jgi:5-methylcytosine-specific restriction protein A
MAIEDRRPGNRQMRIYSRGWRSTTRLVRDDTFGFYMMLVFHSDGDPQIPAEVVRYLAKRKRRRYVRELEAEGLASRLDDGSLKLYEPKPADQRWRYFGGPMDVQPFVAIALAQRPNRVPLPPRIKRLVLARDGHVCGICGREIQANESLDIDHIVPVARGGGDELDNLQPSHASCNRSKGARILVEAA